MSTQGGRPPAVELTIEDGADVRLSAGEAWLAEGPDTERVIDLLLGRSPRGGGTARLGGRRLHGGIARRVRDGLGVVQDVPVAPDVTVRDHLAAGVGVEAAQAALADAPLLAGRGDDPAGVLSGGERTVLAWLRALVTRPSVLVLLRAGAGLDDATFEWAAQQVRRQRDEGVAVLVVPSRPEERAWAEGIGGDRHSR